MNNFDFEQFFIICGPCAIESRSFAMETAAQLKDIFSKLSIAFIYKSSFDKANRSSISSFRGVGMDEGLSILAEIRESIGIPVLTDVHESWQVKTVAQAVDVLQTPAFLCRQSDLISAVAKTGKPVNIKKGQFMAPWDMQNVMEKARNAAYEADASEGQLMVCERGTSFGYGNLVVDMRGLKIMEETCKVPVVFDATHSVQLPGAKGSSSGGERKYVSHLARSAVATGAVLGVFLEAHPQPDKAPCDGPNMLPINELPDLVTELQSIYELVQRL